MMFWVMIVMMMDEDEGGSEDGGLWSSLVVWSQLIGWSTASYNTEVLDRTTEYAQHQVRSSIIRSTFHSLATV